MKPVKSILSWIVPIVLGTLLGTSQTTQTKIPPLKGLYELFEPDTIGIGQALLYSQWIENVWTYAPTTDTAHQLIKEFWYKISEDANFEPTEKDPVASITPVILAKLIQFAQDKNISKQEIIKSWLELCLKSTRNISIQTLSKDLEKIQQSKSTVGAIKAIPLIEKSIKKIENEIQRLENPQILEDQKKIKEETLEKINQQIQNKPTKKSQKLKAKLEKEIIILQGEITRIKEMDQKTKETRIDKLHDDLEKNIARQEKLQQTAQNPKKITEQYNAILNKTLLKTNYLDIKSTKELETIKEPLAYFTKKMANKIGNILDAIRTLKQQEGKNFIPGITEAILWGYFEDKFENKDLNTCLQTLGKEMPKELVDEQEINNFENEIGTRRISEEGFIQEIAYKITPPEIIEKIINEYDIANHYIIAKTTAKSLPKVFSFDTDVLYGKCVENTFLALVEKLWYNPSQKKYDTKILPEAVRSGKGFLQLQTALEKQGYNLGLTWINLLAQIGGENTYKRENNREIRSSMKNLIKFLNYFYGLTLNVASSDYNAICVILSETFSTKEREIHFSFTPPVTIHVNIRYTNPSYKSYNNAFDVIMDEGHAGLRHNQDSSKRNILYKNKQFKILLTKLIYKEANPKLIPLFMSLTNMKTLKQKGENPIIDHLLYYSIQFKHSFEIKYDFIRYAISQKKLGPTILNITYGLIDNIIQENDPFQITEIFVTILNSGIQQLIQRYKEKIKKFYKKNPQKFLHTIGKLQKIIIDKEILKDIVKSNTDINSYGEYGGGYPLKDALKNNHRELIEVLLEHPAIDLGYEIFELIKNTSEDIKNLILKQSIHENAKIGNLEKVKDILKNHKFNLNSQVTYFNMNTPLHLAAQNGHLEIVTFLLNQPDIDVTLTNSAHKTAANIAKTNTIKKLINKYDLALAIEENNLEKIKFILNKTNLNINRPLLFSDPHYRGKIIDVPLNQAIKNNKPEIVKLLLANPNIDVNNNSRSWDSPLLTAIKENNIEMVELLLNHPKIDVNIEQDRQYPLIEALNVGNPAIIKLLLNHPKINVNIKHDHQYPLIKAINKGNPTIIKLLLNHPKIDLSIEKITDVLLDYLRSGNEKEIKDLIQEKLSPLHKATLNNDIETARALLKDKHFNVNIKLDMDGNGKKTALEYAIEKGDILIAGLLLNNPRIKIPDEYTLNNLINNSPEKAVMQELVIKKLYPLHFYIRTNNQKLLQEQLNKSDEWNKNNTDSFYGETPLTFAVQKNNIQLITILLNDKEIDVTKQNQEGETPLDLAQTDEVRELIKKSISEQEKK